MVFAFGPFALIILMSRMAAFVRLRERNRVQAAIQLPIAAGIHTNRGPSTARTRDRSSSSSHCKRRSIAVVSQITSVPDDTGRNDRRDTVNRKELRSEACHERAQVPGDRVDAFVEGADLGASVADLIGKSVRRIARDRHRYKARFHGLEGFFGP